MNVRRGLWRAWIFVSALWVIGAAFFGYLILTEGTGGKYQYVEAIRSDAGEMNSIDWSRPFYEIRKSPAKEKLSPGFSLLEYRYLDGFDKSVREGRMIQVDFPDRSSLYLNKSYDEEDKRYLSAAFWSQRWERIAWASLPVVGWAVIPPLVLLILGMLLFWVFRGFARD
jgi:hypothetical protein